MLLKGKEARASSRRRTQPALAIRCLIALALPAVAFAQNPTDVPALGGGETCSTSTVIYTLPFSDTGTTCGAGNDYDEVCPYAASEAPDVVYAYTPTTDVIVDISLCGNSAYDTKLYVYANACPGWVVGCNDDHCSTPSYAQDFVSRLEGLSLAAGNTYFIVVDGYGGECGVYTIDVTLTGGDFGACCDDAAGTCTDGLQLADCPAPLRFTANMTCADLNPACGQAVGPCCHPDGTCTIVTAAQCTDGTWLGPYATCDLCPCVLSCPSGATPESETCGTSVNGGCDILTPAFETIVPGQAVCGTVWQSATDSDTDWYAVTITAPAILTWTVEAEFPVLTGFLQQSAPGAPGCENLTGYFTALAAGTGDCQPVQITTAPLSAGTYYFSIAIDSSSTITCSSGNDYVVTLSSIEVRPDIRVEPAAPALDCVGAARSAISTAAAAATEAGAAAVQTDFAPPGKVIEPEEIARALAAGQGHADVIVNLKRPAAMATTNFKNARARAALRKEVGGHQDAVLKDFGGGEFTLRHRYGQMASFSGTISAAGLARLKQDPRVASIEPVRLLEAHLSQGIPLMHALAHRSTYNGAGTAIAICDTGIDYNHPMLGGGGFPNSKVIGGYDFGNGDADPIPVGQAHGTCCAGIAAGDSASVGDYIGGVAPGAKLYAVKIAPDYSNSATTDAMVAAWDWCVTHKDDDPNNPILVISTSFGGGRYTTTCDSLVWAMTTAANNAAAAGITLVCSSGNSGYCDALAWPACISSVISVGAVYDAAFGTFYPCVSADSCATKYASGSCPTGYYAIDTTAPDMVAAYSNSAGFLSLLAPSNQVYTTDLIGTAGYNWAASPSGDYYDGFGGTSAACPYAAGAVACLQQAAQAVTGSYLSPLAVKNALATAGDAVADAKIPTIVKPRINLDQAIESLTPCTGQTLTIHNDGTLALTINSIMASPGLTLAPQPAVPYSIPPSSYIAYCVTISCAEACAAGAPLQGSVQIASDDPDQPTTVIPVRANCPTIAADLDRDGDVDLADAAMFTSCFSGPAVPHPATQLCVSADLDRDGDVDQSDYGRFQRCFSGQNLRADPSCDD